MLWPAGFSGSPQISHWGPLSVPESNRGSHMAWSPNISLASSNLWHFLSLLLTFITSILLRSNDLSSCGRSLSWSFSDVFLFRCSYRFGDKRHKGDGPSLSHHMRGHVTPHDSSRLMLILTSSQHVHSTTTMFPFHSLFVKGVAFSGPHWSGKAEAQRTHLTFSSLPPLVTSVHEQKHSRDSQCRLHAWGFLGPSWE